MKPATRIVLVALAAGVLGAGVGVWLNGPGPLLRTELGQRALQGVLSASAPPPPQGLKIAERGGTVPTLTLPALDGHPVELPKAYLGRPVLVNFWATWCAPCRKEMPELDRYARAQGANGTQVVGIALDDKDAVRAYLAQLPIDYPSLLDAPGPRDSSVRLGNPKGVLPYSVLIGADGRLLKHKIGPFAPGEIERWAQ